MGAQGGSSFPIYIRGCSSQGIGAQGGAPLPVYIMGSDLQIWHAYGGFQDQDETISIASVDVWYHITNGTNDLWNVLEAVGITLSEDILIIANAGDYTGTLSMTISGTTTKDFQIRVYNITQGTQTGYEIGATTTGAANFTNITLPLYVEANAGDQLRVEVRCVTNGSDVIVRSAVFTLFLLHG